jgi:hypothetical protein
VPDQAVQVAGAWRCLCTGRLLTLALCLFDRGACAPSARRAAAANSCSTVRLAPVPPGTCSAGCAMVCVTRWTSSAWRWCGSSSATSRTNSFVLSESANPRTHASIEIVVKPPAQVAGLPRTRRRPGQGQDAESLRNVQRLSQARRRKLSTLVRPGWLGNYSAGMTSIGLLIQATPGSCGGTGSWPTKRSG